MKNRLLLSSRYKVYGWVIFLLFAVLHVLINIIYPDFGKEVAFHGFRKSTFWDGFTDSNLTIVGAGILFGLLIVCFSREKNEDEYISYLRLRAWQLSVLISYGILFVANLFIYGAWFLSFMTYNMLTVLIVFIVTFNLSLYKLKRERFVDEK